MTTPEVIISIDNGVIMKVEFRGFKTTVKATIRDYNCRYDPDDEAHKADLWQTTTFKHNPQEDSIRKKTITKYGGDTLVIKE